ncbi:fungal hydrophobin domain-containing protein [Penicillium pulvis]|uniref:fungal hydrophobin domain-containing protein n=1 Tax=Penicillium pulvis TaxID=1562058 RepID=UPI002547D3EF|nr:fungal hydrophobin domain-containing protein [Penicillium pulvis]KAJ5803506.1 fungal hydrophobin domain-containing protein [Penicillium pulvis]
MKASILLLAVSAGAALAQPTSFDKRDGVCPNADYSVALCCTTGILSFGQVDCKTPPSTKDISDFKSSCSASADGSEAQCCDKSDPFHLDECIDA